MLWIAAAVPTEFVAGRLFRHEIVPALTSPLAAVRLLSQTKTGRLTADKEEGYDFHPQYSYGYSVSDALSGDSKTRQESRDGDVVSGSYSVLQPDGRLRTVIYTADKLHGFQADVRYDGEAGPVAIPFDTPIVALDNLTQIDITDTTAENLDVDPGQDSPTAPEESVIAVRTDLPNNGSTIAVNETRSEPSTLNKELDNTPKILQPFSPSVSVTRESPRFVHAVRTAPVFTAARRIPHIVRSAPAISVVRHVPQASHALHKNPVAAFVGQFPQGFHAFHNTPAVSVVRQVPQAIHTLHNTPVLSVVRQVPQAVHAFHNTPVLSVPQAVHAVHNSPSVSVVRRIPQTVHAVHNSPSVSVVKQFPQTVHAVHSTPAVSVVRQVPQAVHAAHSTKAVSAVRQVPQAIHSTHSLDTRTLQSLLGNSGLDLSQFRFISPVNLIQN